MDKQTTKLEHSAGGVVFKQKTANDKQPKIHYLIGKHSGYHKWVLPKGLIEAGETALQTAVREVQEEMGITAKIVDPLPIHTDTYTYWADYKDDPTNVHSPVRRVKKYQEEGGHQIKVTKTVDFYLLEWLSGDPRNHGWEMETSGWFEYNEAMSKLAFTGEKQTLLLAHDKILKAVR